MPSDDAMSGGERGRVGYITFLLIRLACGAARAISTVSCFVEQRNQRNETREGRQEEGDETTDSYRILC